MKILDYTGLSRLTTNIKSYIASKLQPIDDRTPYFVKGMGYILGNNFGYGTFGDMTFDLSPGSAGLTLNASSTGNAKALYDRLVKGLPSALIIPITSTRVANGLGPFGSWPFFPDTDGITDSQTSTITTVNYKCALKPQRTPSWGVNHGLSITITRPRGDTANATILVKSIPVEGEEVRDISIEPYHAKMFSVDASGTVSPLGTLSITPSSTGDTLALYNRMLQGWPPAIKVNITMSDGTTLCPVWLYMDTIASGAGNVVYKSGEIANGTYTGKYLRLNMTRPTSTLMRVALNLFSITT